MALMIESGQVVRTVSGRLTSPAPNFDMSTNRKALNSLKRLYGWLYREALKEVEGDDWRTTLVKAIDPKRTSQSDIDTLNLILFGEV